MLVRISEAEEATKGGLIIPDTARENPNEGDVIAVGSGRWTKDSKTIPFDVKVGDRVIFAEYGCVEM